jgi:hypothetical protein
VNHIGKSAFEGCAKLTTVSIPDYITCISDNTFDGCKALTSVIIPKSVSCIGQGAFQGCDSLKFLCIPSSVDMIESGAFWSDRRVGAQITIPRKFLNKCKLGDILGSIRSIVSSTIKDEKGIVVNLNDLPDS